MTKYIAHFSNGDTQTRNSKRTYTHAYLLTRNGHAYGAGFSASRELAEKAARGYGPKDITPRDKKNAQLRKWHRELAAKKGFKTVDEWYASEQKRVSDWWAEAKVEIVEVEIA